MRIKTTISSRVISQNMTDQGVETIFEVGFMAGGGVHKQKLFAFQSHDDIRNNVFKLDVREVIDDNN